MNHELQGFIQILVFTNGNYVLLGRLCHCIRQYFIPSIKINVKLACGCQMLLASPFCQTKLPCMFLEVCILSCGLQMAPVVSLSILCPGLGVLSDRDQTGGSESAGPGLTPRGATLHGDPTQQWTPGPEECPHEGSAQLHSGTHRPGTATICSQR